MSYIAKTLQFEPDSLEGISQKTIENHFGKLYLGYVAKYNEVIEKSQIMMNDDQLKEANQSYSQWRGLKDGETFTLDAILLHEMYFANLGGKGAYNGLEIEKALIDRYGSMDEFEDVLMATGMAARGWAVVAINPLDGKFHIYVCDSHNQGGIWRAKPILILDVYEHAYFMDYGTDRKSYIEAFWKNIDWSVVNERFLSVGDLVE